MATSTANDPTPPDMESEILYLRQQNQRLQSQLDKLLNSSEADSFSNEHDCNSPHRPSSSALGSSFLGSPEKHGENKSPLPPGKELARSKSDPSQNGVDQWAVGRRKSPPPPPSTLHHRRILRRDEEGGGGIEMSPSVMGAKPSGSFSPSGRTRMKSKVSEIDVIVSNGKQPNLPFNTKDDDEIYSDEGSSLMAKQDTSVNENRRGYTRDKKSKRARDGGGDYSNALTLDDDDDSFDEEECRGFSNEHDEDEGDDSDDIIDDDSHNKHQPPPKPPLCGANRPRSRPSSSNAASTASTLSFRDAIKDRAGWLIGLLFLQSCSSFIIQHNEGFLQKHMVIVQFLTMLVGAGGNAGNQASVRVIRELALGTLNERTMKPFLKQEAKMALGLSALLGLTGFIRAALFRTPPGETIAVTASLCAIVAISVAIGSTLPLGMKRIGIDPAHSSTTIQVLMDIFGVLITVSVSSLVLGFKIFMNEDTGEDAGSTS